jgi:FkbM family methyltransferase
MSNGGTHTTSRPAARVGYGVAWRKSFSSRAKGLFTAITLTGLRIGSGLRHRVAGHGVVALVCDTPNGLLAVDSRDLGVGRHLAAGKHYEKELVAEVISSVRPNSNVLIVGAHVGSIAIPVAKSGASVQVFEPNPNTRRLLEMNVLLNGVGDRLIVHPFAASDQPGKITFLANTVNSGGSKARPVHKRFRYVFDRPEEITVDAVRLDDVLDGCFDVMVMDIEGSEYQALMGMPRLLHSVRTLVLEVDPHHIRDVAGVSASEFSALLQERFKTFRRVGSRDVRPISELAVFVHDLDRTGSRADVVLSAD